MSDFRCPVVRDPITGELLAPDPCAIRGAEMMYVYRIELLDAHGEVVGSTYATATVDIVKVRIGGRTTRDFEKLFGPRRLA